MSTEQKNEYRRLISGKSIAISIINKWASEGKGKTMRQVFLEFIRKN
jgi:hypothetical protein